MSKRVLVLVLAVFIAAMLVVEMRHRNRLRFVELQALQGERDALDTEWGQLLLEQGAWSEHRRVEDLARAQLGMLTPRTEQVTVIYRQPTSP